MSFRTKLVLALFAVVAPVLIAALFVLHRETNRQIQSFIATSLTTAQAQLAQVERIRQTELRQLGIRFAGQNRWPAALQEALSGDTAYLRSQVEYDLGLAGVNNALAAFADLDGNAVFATVAGQSVEPSAAVPAALLDRLARGDTAIFGYHPLGAQLFSVHPVVLEMFEQPIGVVLLGSPLDDGVARLIGSAIGAEVCFVAGEHCVASTDGARDRALARAILQAARDSTRRRAEVDGHNYAFVSQPLGGAAANVVLALLLDQVLAPFRRIQQALLAVAVVSLLLAIMLALVLGHGLAVPVRLLVRATERVARGEYDTRVEVRSRDELGTLADAFNQMTYGLMLKDKYRGVLDKVVSRDIADELLKGEIQLGGENREVTMLFADIRGFTPLTEGMEPQNVIGLLNEIMEHLGSAVEAEGGVVDKYVGDEVMALFGAPIARADDAERAIRAALAMQRDINDLNQRRAAERLAPIGLGIGLNTGNVVAGNMGSQKRLNYTVLGDAVNLAARLCSAARPGEIIVTRETLVRLGDRYLATPLGERSIKGFSGVIELFRVDGPTVPVAAGHSVHLGSIPWACGLWLAAAAAASAQSIAFQPGAHVELTAFVPGSSPAWLVRNTDPFIAGRVSLYGEAFLGDRIYALAEMRADRGEVPGSQTLSARIEQLFLRFSPIAAVDFNLQAGKFISPFGNYPGRSHSSADPFIRPPLSYDYRTVMSATAIPPTTTRFLEWKDETREFRERGSPAVWAVPYQVGALVFGTLGPLSARMAVMNSAPSSDPALWDPGGDAAGPSYVAHAAIQLDPSLRIGASWDRGPYLNESTAAVLELSGRAPDDFMQEIFALELTATRGLVELRGEVMLDRWEVPNVAEYLRDVSFYGEAKWKVWPGLALAARYGRIDFNRITADGRSEPWDYDLQRWQLGGMYNLTEKIVARAELMLNRGGTRDPSDDLLSIQLSRAFGARR